MARAHTLRWLQALTLAAMLWLGACARSPEHASPHDLQAPDQTEAVIVSLSTGHHKRADLALREGRRQDAIQEMQTLLETVEPHLPPPAGAGSAAADKDAPGATSYDVIFDAAGRLARMHLEDEHPDLAEASARRGLRYAPAAPPSLFKGHLYQILGDALEARDDPRGAVEAHGDAIKIFRAMLDEKTSPQPGNKEAP